MVPIVSLIFSLLCFPLTLASKNIDGHHESCHQCLYRVSNSPSNQVQPIIHDFFSDSYWPILLSATRNLRFNFTNTPKPICIITPQNYEQVKRTVVCTKRCNAGIRIRSGGHDYEGQSQTDPRPFVLLDLQNLRKVDVNVKDKTAWVEAGASLGELYYHIAQKSDELGFPAGICPTVGVGGHISGGGHGIMWRKYGLAADNVVDALIVDVRGRLLLRKQMGEDVFWAIRGGGAASYGVVICWKIKLVEVPKKVTVFTVVKSLEEGANKLLVKWQKIAYKLPEDLYIRLAIGSLKNKNGKQTIKVAFNSLYMGSIQKLLPLMKKEFPELDLKASDCQEKSWIDSVLYFAKVNSTEGLLDRKPKKLSFQKTKSDYVTKPMPEKVLTKLWKVFVKGNPGMMFIVPSGGKMSEISEHEIPYPHRAGTLFGVLYLSEWWNTSRQVANEKYEWIDRVYKFMGKYVSKPRTAYLNYKDLDLGKDLEGVANYTEAAKWGKMYFKDNFKKLAEVKYRFDPENFFRNDQSIPPLPPQNDKYYS